jgi:phosphonatase-like hydrolase
MKTEIKLAIFDLAGTTISDRDYVAIAFIDAFIQYGIDLSVEEITPLMGYRKTEAIQLVLKVKGIESTDKMIEDIHRHFVNKMVRFYTNSIEVEELAGARHIFSWLKNKGVFIGVNSGFPRVIVETIVDRMDWMNDGLVDAFVASDEVESGRPHPFMINLLMQKAGITNPAQVMKVGDTMVDIQEGKNASVGLVIGVTTGAYSRVALEEWNPDYIIDSLYEIEQILS